MAFAAAGKLLGGAGSASRPNVTSSTATPPKYSSQKTYTNKDGNQQTDYFKENAEGKEELYKQQEQVQEQKLGGFSSQVQKTTYFDQNGKPGDVKIKQIDEQKGDWATQMLGAKGIGEKSTQKSSVRTKANGEVLEKNSSSESFFGQEYMAGKSTILRDKQGLIDAKYDYNLYGQKGEMSLVGDLASPDRRAAEQAVNVNPNVAAALAATTAPLPVPDPEDQALFNDTRIRNLGARSIRQVQAVSGGGIK